MKEIDCSSNHLQDIKFPSSVEQLTSLSISYNKFNQDLSFLSPLVNLKYLSLSGNSFTGSLKPLRNTMLDILFIKNTKIDDGLEYLPENLTYLCCNNLWAEMLRDYEVTTVNDTICYNYRA
jgi:Leucine-rich repeat (LRR) protein